MQGYFGDPKATAHALFGGWLDTGDLGFLEGGELYVHGRAKDVVIVRGANRAPEEFEAPLADVAGLRPGCAVAVGSAEEGEGEELLLLAERAKGAAHPGGEEEDRALKEGVRRAVLAATGVSPRKVELLAPGTLPRTSSGKLRRGEALRRYSAGMLSPPPKVTAVRMAAHAARSQLSYARAVLISRRPGKGRER